MGYSNLLCPYCGWESEPGSLYKVTETGNPICPKCDALLSSEWIEEEESEVSLPYPLDKFSPKVDRLYLATPYTSNDRTLMETRYEISLFASAAIIDYGFEVYSPIVYTHVIAHQYKIKPDDSDFWVALDENYIRYWATGLITLMIPGYSLSSGVAREQELARSLGIEQVFISMETLYDITRALPSRLD